MLTRDPSQKRYERMLKAHGISRPGALAANNGDASAETPPATPTKRKAKGEAASSAKKPRTPRAKAKAKKESSDDEEPEPKPKASATKRKVKKEEEQEEEKKETSAEAPDSVSGMYCRYRIYLTRTDLQTTDAPASDES